MKLFIQILALIHLTIALEAQCEINTDFGVNGKSQISLASGSKTEVLQNSFLDSNDGIVGVGYSFTNTHDAMSMSFHNSNGSANEEVNGNGKIIINETEDNYGQVGLFTAEGKYLFGGHWNFFSNEQFKFRQFHADGSPDSSFGVEGEVFPFIQGSVIQRTTGISQDSFGNILATGYADIFNEESLVFMKLSQYGNIIIQPEKITLPTITSFISDRQTKYKNKILVSGEGSNGTQSKGVVVRISEDGVLDPNFGLSGVALTPILNGTNSKVINALSTGDETIFVVGYHIENDRNILFLRSLNDEGKLTEDFFDDGYSLYQIPTESIPVDFAIHNDGLYVAMNNQSNSTGQVYKFNLTGELDNTFGVEGIYYLESEAEEKLTRIHFNSMNELILTGISDNDFTVWNLSCEQISSNSEPNTFKVNVFPNPTSEKINLTFDDPQTINEILVFNSLGQVIIKEVLNSNNMLSLEVNLRGIPLGNYHLRIQSNKQIYITKFIKS